MLLTNTPSLNGEVSVVAQQRPWITWDSRIRQGDMLYETRVVICQWTVSPHPLFGAIIDTQNGESSSIRSSHVRRFLQIRGPHKSQWSDRRSH